MGGLEDMDEMNNLIAEYDKLTEVNEAMDGAEGLSGAIDYSPMKVNSKR